MICENPFTKFARAFPCGACVPCRIRRKQIWKTRLTLEATAHEHNSFVTLTYKENPLAPSGLPTLIPHDLKNWLKRFRKAISPSKIRFYAAGEYGDKHQRPHYHAILFGYRGCAYGESRYKDGRTIDCCYQCDLVRDTWGLGIIELKPMANEHAAYVCGYVMKKMTSKTDTRLNGRYPEFSRQSNQNGGIGINAVAGLSRTAHQRISSGAANDVPTAVRINGKISPLGRYIRQQVRKALGGDGKAPPEVIAQMEAEMLPLLYASQTDPENITLKKQIVARCRGDVASLKARTEMFNSRKRNNSL